MATAGKKERQMDAPASILLIDYRVETFADWKAVFDADPMDRAAHGVDRYWIHRDPDDPSHHLLGMAFATLQQARAFREAMAPVWDVSGAAQYWILQETDAASAGDATPLPEPTSTKPLQHFAYKLMPPRPTFPADMTDGEASIMQQHFAYWKPFEERGIVVVLGPVLDPAGTWGLGIVAAESEDAMRALAADDPAVKTGMSTFEVWSMADPFVRS
jgi:uncharacterized protein